MSIGKKNKDHIKQHSVVDLLDPLPTRRLDDPLRFWTGHLSENTLVDLRPFADGELENKYPNRMSNWGGPFKGRPRLIEQLAPAIQARLSLVASKTISVYTTSLRAWWRLFDHIESIHGNEGGKLVQVESLADLNELHEAIAHQSGMSMINFKTFLSVVNAARTLHRPRLPKLLWEPPESKDPIRILISDEQAREIKICLKQDWESVRRTWEQYDDIRIEAQMRAIDIEGVSGRDVTSSKLQAGDEVLLKNWLHLQRIQDSTGRILPTGKQLLDGKHSSVLSQRGLERKLMRAILFPTAHDADVAFHLALMNSGWNPSTLANLDGSSEGLVINHPKGPSQTVLVPGSEFDEEVMMQAEKPRAHSKAQFCVGLKKHKSSPPVIVATYLQRVAPLRKQLISDYQAAASELKRLQQDANTSEETYAQHYKKVNALRKGCRSVWLYVDINGRISWLDCDHWKRYPSCYGSKKSVSYLDQVIVRLNRERERRGKTFIPNVTPSDFRDIYARWVCKQAGGNILAVMLALGHSCLSSTGRYLDNNIFSAESDEDTRRFMTQLFSELKQGRVDLAILAQLIRHGPLTPDMQARLEEYRQLMRSRLGVACADPYNPPANVAPNHLQGRLCGPQRCLRECEHARFLPESLDGIAMRIEELYHLSDCLPRETWLRSELQDELDDGESLLKSLYPPEQADEMRQKWRGRIQSGDHLVPGLGQIVATNREAA